MKRNGKEVPQRISVPEGGRFKAAEMNAACDAFLRSRGLIKAHGSFARANAAARKRKRSH